MFGENYPDQDDKELIKAIASLKSETEIQHFLRDILTLKEIKEASNRFKIARMLWEGGKSYLEIAEECKTSTTTVTRVNDWLRNKGLNGYKTALERLYPDSKK